MPGGPVKGTTTASSTDTSETRSPDDTCQSPSHQYEEHDGGADPEAALKKEKHGHHSHEHKRHHKAVTRLPFFRLPAKEKDGPWLREGHEGSIWFTLFYDLAMVAVLSVFDTTHSLDTPSAIPIYLSYFVLVSWLWTSQVHYDIRYQAEDTFHRLIKAAQIVIFLYIGAASGSWDPETIRSPQYIPNITPRAAALRSQSQASYTTIILSFLLSRLLLLLQYASTIYFGRKCGRPIQPMILLASSILLSMAISITAVALPFSTSEQCGAKIALVYVSVLVEAMGIFWKRGTAPVKTEDVADRYGALTLIILGEGFISVTRALSLSIAGLSDSASATYLQVFLVIAIICMIFVYLFGQFKKEDKTSQTTALAWEAIHLPLHFILLLLLAAMTNIVVLLSFGNGMTVVSKEFAQTLSSLENNTIACTVCDQPDIDQYLAVLPLVPDYGTEYQKLVNMSHESPPMQDPLIAGEQYFGQLVIQTTQSYGLELSDEMLAIYQELIAINTTVDGNYSTADRDRSKQLSFDLLAAPLLSATSGVLWLFPAAGGVLILCSLRSMIWYRFEGLTHWIVHLPMILAGLGLCLLGLLDIGTGSFEVSSNASFDGVSPIFTLLRHSLPLAIVLIVYVLTYFGSLIALTCLSRRKNVTFEMSTFRWTE